MIVNPFTVREIPFKKADYGALPPQVLGEFNSGKTNLVFHGCISIESDDDFPAFPRDPIQIENRSLDIEPLTIRRGGFADSAAPIENAGDADGKETRIVLYAELCQPPERQCLELAFGDDQRQLCISQQRTIGAWRKVKHVAAAGRAQVLLFHLDLAAGIRFEIGMVAS